MIKAFIQRWKHSPRRRYHYDKYVFTIAILAIIVCLYGSSVSITGMHSSTPIPEPDVMEKELYNEINQFRADNDIAIITRSAKLEGIARDQSTRLAKNENISYYIAIYEQNNLYCNFHAETILITDNSDILSELILNETLAAPLLDPKLERIGIGIAINESIYVTQNYCG